MINFSKTTLTNGLRVLVHSDFTSPIVAMNLLYGVGSRDEHPDMTGFAHLFEHLMFGGSANIPDYDTPLQLAGGENNAFTNNDYTNYYLTLPHQNIETGFWLESDRMQQLAFKPKNLETQKSVVIEEFKQRYLNQPYGDLWLHLRPLAFTTHPYRWPTIGREVRHIEQASLDDVKSFFSRFYTPGNAILTLAGHIHPDEAFRLAEKWFGQINRQHNKRITRPQEPEQDSPRFLRLQRPVPHTVVMMAYHMESRHTRQFYMADLASDLLASGLSSRFQNRLVREQKLFSELDAYLTGDEDPGLFIVSGHLNPGIREEEAIRKIEEELSHLSSEPISEKEMRKVKNRVESNFIFSHTNILTRAMNLSYHEWLGDAEKLNHELEIYDSITENEIRTWAQERLIPANCSTLVYQALSNPT